MTEHERVASQQPDPSAGDAFDQFHDWAARLEEPAERRRPVAADVLAAVMSLPLDLQTDRAAVNDAVQRKLAKRAAGKTVWLYFDPGKPNDDPHQLKVFASAEAADRWFARNDPEGV